MLRRFTTLLTLWLFLFISGSTCLSAAGIYEGRIIRKIDVSVVGEQDSSKAQSVVLSRINSAEGELFSQNQFDSDLKLLTQEFDWIEPEIDPGADGLYIKIQVWPRALIRTIKFKGNDSFSEKTLLDEMDVSPCSLLDRTEFHRAFSKLKTFYIKKGFFEVQLNYEIFEDECPREVDIEIEICEGRSGKIKEIYFTGFDKCECEEILDLMVTKRWDVVSYFMNDQGMYNEEAIQHDQFQILSYLQNRGFADARVTVTPVPDCKPGRLNIVVSADKGEQYTFGKITFKGNCLFDNDIIDSLIVFDEGDYYSPDALRDTIKNITDAYGIKGYIEASVDDELSLHHECPIYDVNFFIEEGDQYRVGMIKIFGNVCTDSNVILHETLLCPGEVFNILKLKLTEDRLRGIGFFKCVNVYPVKSEAFEDCEGRYRDVHIELEETATGNFGAFSGFSSTDDIFGGFSITERNFNIRGIRRKSWRQWGASGLKGGGEYLHFTATFGQKTSSYALSWTKPYFQDTAWSIGFDVDRTYNGAVSEDYELIATGFSVFAKREINAFLRFGVHYRLRDSRTKVFNPIISYDLSKVGRYEGLVSAIGTSLIYDSTNSLVRPTKGVRSRLDLEYAGVGGEFFFFSTSYVNSFYYSLSKRGVLRYRADAKFITPVRPTRTDEIPLDERFFLGGDYLIRGYRPYAIGPKFPGTNDPTGGVSLVLISAEYDYLLFSRASAFLFCDSGSISNRQWHVSELKSSIGYGLKMKVLDGAPPFVIGMGYPLNARDRSDVKRFFISLGARF